MGILRAILHFIGGKPADIFNEVGRVQHKHPKSKWEAWQGKYFNSAEYNWRAHKGSKNSGIKSQ